MPRQRSSNVPSHSPWIWLLLCASSIAGDEQQGPELKSTPSLVGNWPLETLVRTDGRELHGLLQQRSPKEVAFVEVVRPQGQPWYLVVHYLRPEEVKQLRMLDGNDRTKLLERVRPLLEHRGRARIEAMRMQQVTLTTVERNGRTCPCYSGELFDLESTADEETTRRCVVRIDQVFRALRHLFPPKMERRSRPRVVIFGSVDEYQSRFRVVNPAFYDQQNNTIYAACELSKFGAQLHQVRRQNDEILKQYRLLDQQFSARLAEVSKQMAKNGYSPAEIQEEVRLRSAAWERKRQAGMENIRQLERRNEARFNAVTQEMFRQLNHESFHAFVENFVYPGEQKNLPRWLNEGLAQILESCQLDGDTLRLDAPDLVLLEQLKRDLQSDGPLALRSILTADDASFSVRHDTDRHTQRQYIYAWGLAYYLVFHRDLLQSATIDAYVAKQSDNRDRVWRFEALVGDKLSSFESRWRRTMLELPPTTRRQ